MRQLFVNPLPLTEMILTVEPILHNEAWFFLIEPTDTVTHLKKALCPLLGASVAEVALFVDPAYPYPLRDDLLLRNLKEEHRSLLVVIYEAPDRVIPSRVLSTEQMAVMAGPHPIARPPRAGVLDFRWIYPEDIPYLTRWIMMGTEIGRVDVHWTSTLLRDILREISPILYASFIWRLWIRRDPETTAEENAEVCTISLLSTLCQLARDIKIYPPHGFILVDPGILNNDTNHVCEYSEEKLKQIMERMERGRGQSYIRCTPDTNS